MSEKNISQEVLDKIKTEKIKPRPKWEFLLKEYLIWVVGVLCLVVGSLAFATVIYMVRFNDWDFYKNIDASLWKFVLLSAPYFWLIILALFIWLVDLNIKHTKKGYKYDKKLVVLGVVLASIFLGGILYGFGVGKRIDRLASEKMPFYTQVINPRMKLLLNPERGLLIGVISSVESRDRFNLYDQKGNLWVVDISRAPMSVIEPIKGLPIKAFGKKKVDFNFEAIIIRPVGPGEGCFHNDNPGGCFHERFMMDREIFKHR